MLKEIRQNIIEKLWVNYYNRTPQVKQIDQCLRLKGINQITLDHLAIIDLPGPHTGIRQLCEIFSAIGYRAEGSGYLPEKQNDFLWMAEEDSHDHAAGSVLPQVVVADFRLEEMPENVRAIIEKYGNAAKPSPIAEMRQLIAQLNNGSNSAGSRLTALITEYLSHREWPLPTLNEFQTVHEFNELLAWVLVFGRCPNHFTISVHLLPAFSSLTEFHRFIETDAGLRLNRDGGIIKGSHETGIEQGSTIGEPEIIQLADGSAELPTGFVEFVWRFADKKEPYLWGDYFTGFVANHANRVIQSLYVEK